MSDEVRELIVQQRGRVVAGILQHAERSFYDRLSPAERTQFRQKVLDSVGVYHDLVLDVLKVQRKSSTVINEEVLPLLRAIHREIRLDDG